MLNAALNVSWKQHRIKTGLYRQMRHSISTIRWDSQTTVYEVIRI